mmetsp:Transcript_62878/g.137768  ORF Transcript_62878/g.137768 Transcript_62878/m.137768 type:complete len:228 (+) Transcript_62878:287-970(+)
MSAMILKSQVLFPGQPLGKGLAALESVQNTELLISMLQTQGANCPAHCTAEHASLSNILCFFIIFCCRDGINIMRVHERVDVTYRPRVTAIIDTKNAHTLWNEGVQCQSKVIINQQSGFGQLAIGIWCHKCLVKASLFVSIEIRDVHAMACPKPNEPVANFTSSGHLPYMSQHKGPRRKAWISNASLVSNDGDVIYPCSTRHAVHGPRIFGAGQLRCRGILIVQGNN